MIGDSLVAESLLFIIVYITLDDLLLVVQGSRYQVSYW